MFQERVTEKPYVLTQWIDVSELEDYYCYTRAYGFWTTLQLWLKGRHCTDPDAPAPVSIDDAPKYTKALGESLQAAIECQRSLAEIRVESFCIGDTCVVPIVRPLPLDNVRLKKPEDAKVPPLTVDARWETLVHPMVLALRAEWANCCATQEVRRRHRHTRTRV